MSLRSCRFKSGPRYQFLNNICRLRRQIAGARNKLRRKRQNPVRASLCCENCLWQFARKSSDANLVGNREVSGSPEVSQVRPAVPSKKPSSDGFLLGIILAMSELEGVVGNYSSFLDDILARTEAEGFDLNDFIQIDHICYRTVSAENYDQKKDELTSVSKLLGETMINGRPISTFRLTEPIRHGRWRIDAVELPAPKAGSDFAEGLEHIEFVLYDDMPTFLQKYDGKPFKLNAADRGINPEVALKLGDMSVKFHLLNLPTVVYLEHKLGITEVRDGQ